MSLIGSLVSTLSWKECKWILIAILLFQPCNGSLNWVICGKWLWDLCFQKYSSVPLGLKKQTDWFRRNGQIINLYTAPLEGNPYSISASRGKVTNRKSSQIYEGNWGLIQKKPYRKCLLPRPPFLMITNPKMFNRPLVFCRFQLNSFPLFSFFPPQHFSPRLFI